MVAVIVTIVSVAAVVAVIYVAVACCRLLDFFFMLSWRCTVGAVVLYQYTWLVSLLATVSALTLHIFSISLKDWTLP